MSAELQDARSNSTLDSPGLTLCEGAAALSISHLAYAARLEALEVIATTGASADSQPAVAHMISRAVHMPLEKAPRRRFTATEFELVTPGLLPRAIASN